VIGRDSTDMTLYMVMKEDPWNYLAFDMIEGHIFVC